MTDLSLVPGGKAFLHINGGAARVSIPAGPAGDTLLEIEDAGLSVKGHAAASGILLRPNVPFVLNGFAVPTMYAALSFSEAIAGSLTVNYAPLSELDPLGARLEASRPCGDVGLQGKPFEASAARPDYDEKKKTAVKLIEPGQKVDLRTEPKGKPVARLSLKDATLVEVFESSGGMSRVSLPVDTLWVFGWVKSSDLRPAGDMAGYGIGRGRFGVKDPKWAVEERLRCDMDVPLVAEAFGERRLVGAIRKNTVIEVISRTETEVRVGVKTKAIHAAEDAVFLVRAGDLSGCGKVER